tara:strand:+ start:1710 stop:2285 length:576 start_codon:yes stop_codon:yes gene_type:complete
MIKVGIIGDIGSGKSFVAKQFGYPVFNADAEVNKIYKKNKICFNRLKNKLPRYISSFPVKKKELGKAVIQNKNNLKKIIKIVHPIVRANMNNFFRKNKNKKMVVLDVPLLLENKINKKNYVLVFVNAKKKEIQRRLKKRPNYNEKMFNILKKIQLPLEIKKKKSKFIINNNFKSYYIKKNVKILKNKILYK